MEDLIRRSIIGGLLIGTLALLYFYCPPWFISSLILILFFFTLGIEGTALKLGNWSLIYPTVPVIVLILLNEGPYRSLLPFLFITVFSFDSTAYVIGNLIGKHKLNRISPKKTWEGVIGGIISTWLVVYIVYYYADHAISLTNLVYLVIPLTITAMMGDLFESYLKRKAHIKDSSRALGPHGGILDRFDGIFGSILLLYFAKNFFIKFGNF